MLKPNPIMEYVFERKARQKGREPEDAVDFVYMSTKDIFDTPYQEVERIQLASLKDRVREVGVKMAIGAPGREIFLSFMTEALLLTGLGSLAGLLVGIVFSKVITSSIETPLSFAPMSFVWAVLLAGVFGFVFALYPAWKASRLSPMEALRYE